MKYAILGKLWAKPKIDRALDPVPDGPALHVTKGQQCVGAVGRV